MDVGCSSWGHWVDFTESTERLHFQFSLSWIEEENGNPLQYSCLENPRDGGVWWAAVYGSHRVGNDWSDLAAAAAAAAGRAKANRVLSRECTGHSKYRFPTTQEKTLHMNITRWSTPKSDWLYSLQPKMEKLYTVNKNKTRSWLWLRSWTPYCQIQT